MGRGTARPLVSSPPSLSRCSPDGSRCPLVLLRRRATQQLDSSSCRSSSFRGPCLTQMLQPGPSGSTLALTPPSGSVCLGAVQTRRQECKQRQPAQLGSTRAMAALFSRPPSIPAVLPCARSTSRHHSPALVPSKRSKSHSQPWMRAPLPPPSDTQRCAPIPPRYTVIQVHALWPWRRWILPYLPAIPTLDLRALPSPSYEVSRSALGVRREVIVP